MSQLNFFDIGNRYASLDSQDGVFVEIDAMVPWESFRGRP